MTGPTDWIATLYDSRRRRMARRQRDDEPARQMEDRAWEERQMADRDDHPEVTEISTPMGRLKHTGRENANLILLAVTVIFIALVSYQMSREHERMTAALNDVFIAVMTPSEIKSGLSGPLKERLEEKVKEKTLRKLRESE